MLPAFPSWGLRGCIDRGIALGRQILKFRWRLWRLFDQSQAVRPDLSRIYEERSAYGATPSSDLRQRPVDFASLTGHRLGLSWTAAVQAASRR